MKKNEENSESLTPITRLLVDMDLILKIQRYKFGVLYLDKTPETEEDLFQGHVWNSPSPSFLFLFAGRLIYFFLFFFFTF